MRKLSAILVKLSVIYKKNHKKEFPIGPGFFCENAAAGVDASKSMVASQRERRYSDDIKMPEEENKINNELTFTTKTNGPLSSCRSSKTFDFGARAGSVLNAEGRAMFKDLMRAMKLTHLQILRKVVDVQSDEIIKRLLMSEQKCEVRVYIVRAMNLAARDSDSPSDPYVKVTLGENCYDERKNYVEDDMEPDIYKMF